MVLIFSGIYGSKVVIIVGVVLVLGKQVEEEVKGMSEFSGPVV